MKSAFVGLGAFVGLLGVKIKKKKTRKLNIY